MSVAAERAGRTTTSLRGRLMRCAGVAVAVGAVSLSGASAMALADGGQTIAGATPVAYGQLESGNTANGSVTTDGLNGYESYWALPVTGGDNVVIDWHAPLDASGNGPLFSSYEVGTTDAGLADANPIASDTLAANGTDEMTFTADATGIVPLQFESNECCSESAPGAYQFTASVTHAVVLNLPSVSSLSARGTISVAVANPDGVGLTDSSLAVDLQVQSAGGSWTTIGTASAVAGAARVTYDVPASLDGKTVKLEALAHGAAYQTQTSTPQSVSVAASTSGSGSGANAGSGRGSSGGGSSCVVPTPVGKRLRLAKHALKGAGCRLGHVGHTRVRHSGRGRVIWQSLVPGTHLPDGTRVTLVVGR